MKPLPTVIAFTFILLLSCNPGSNKTKDQPPAEETPKALQGEKSSSSFGYEKRSYNDDLVETIFRELAGKSDELTKLESARDEIVEMKNDSTISFIEFNNKNERFYKNAESHMVRIKDSLLRKRIVDLLVNNRSNYDNRIAGHKAILNNIDTRQVTLDDLYESLKIIRTVATMEKYQKEHITSTLPLKTVANKIDQTIAYTDTLIKK